MRIGDLQVLRCPTHGLLFRPTGTYPAAPWRTSAASHWGTAIATAFLMLIGCAGAAGDPSIASELATAAAGSSPSAESITAREAHERADAAVDELVAGFWNGSAFTKTPRGTDGAPYWLNAQALDAVLDGVERTGGRWADVARAFIAAQDTHR